MPARFTMRLVAGTRRQLPALLVFAFLLGAIPLAAQPAGRVVNVDRGARDPAVSPDGRRIAASVMGRICLIPAAGGIAQVISSGPGWDRHPAWSPDGQFLAYAHELDGRSHLAILNLATGLTSFLYYTDAGIGEISYAPAGGDIFFTVNHGQFDGHIWRIPVRGGDAKQITQTEGWHEWSFSPSPDAKRLLLVSGQYGGANLYLLALDSLASTRLTNTPLDDVSVAWSRDGQTLAYVESGNAADRFFVRPAGTPSARARLAATSPYRDSQVAFGPDAGRLVVCAARKLFWLDLRSGAFEPIPFTASFVLPALAPAEMVVVNARLIDGSGGPPIPNASIVIREGRIDEVVPGGPPASAQSLPVVDAHGESVLPGLMDNHYHFWDAFDGPRLLARGITTIRDPGADLADSLNFKDAIALGLIPGPDIYAAGPLIDGMGAYHPMVATAIDRPDEAAALVRSLKEQGVDLLKVYFLLKPEVLRAVIASAHSMGLRVTGHIGVKTGWGQAVDDGIDGLNHIRVWADFLPSTEQPQGDNRSLDAEFYLVPRMQADWREIDPDGAAATALIEKMAKAQIGFDPTLSIQRLEPAMRKQLDLDSFTNWQQSYQRMGRFVVRAVEMGVPLLAGTDDGSLFDEMEAYQQAGVPAQAVIQSATANGARWLRKQADFGAILPGRRADLIFVNGDPLAKIQDLRKIDLVIKDGRIVFRQ